MYKNGNVPSGSFGVRQTYGILQRAEHKIEQSSDRLVILHLGGPVRVERRLDGKLEQALVEPGGMFSMLGRRIFGCIWRSRCIAYIFTFMMLF